MNDKTRKIVGWVISGAVAAMLIMSAIMKLKGAPEAMDMLTGWGFTESEITMIGVGELISAILFLIPKTSSLGTLLLSAYFGGAIASHMQAAAPGESYMIPAILLIVVWIAALIRNREMFSSFTS